MMGTKLLSAALAGVVLVAAAQIGEDVQDVNELYPRFIFDSIPLLEKRQVKQSMRQVAVLMTAIATSVLAASQSAVKVDQDVTTHARYLSTTVPYHQRQAAVRALALPLVVTNALNPSAEIVALCISTINTATVNTVSATPTGCISGQFSCPANVGGGCCGNGQTCTALASKLYCAGGGGSTTARETGGAALTSGTASVAISTSSSTSETGSGLSSGAKAGIGVGVTLGVILIVGLLAWFILSRRRRHREATASASGPPMSSVSSGFGPGNPVGHASPPNSTGPDYFSIPPQHGHGPYSHSQAAGAAGMGAYTPGGYTPGGRGAVPVSPQGPNDIATPVEIAESAVTSPGESGMGSPVRGVTAEDWKPPPESTKDRMELE
ncbi:MAG: hypothetical protein M1836_005458 [Candelina mexicana]|nr:MAG: hypothetical protein M1836_005458 [Candelina mexicana]